MKQYTRKQLWAFVHRADTFEKIRIADDWLREDDHFEMVVAVGGVDLWDDLMACLAFTSRQLCHDQIVERMKPEYKAMYIK